MITAYVTLALVDFSRGAFRRIAAVGGEQR